MTILVLDDDPLVLKGLGKALKRAGYRVFTAPSASEAIEVARAELLDLVICDVRMPDIDGLEAIGLLRQLQGGLRTIVITGYADDSAPIRAIKNGVDDYLFKPFATEDLLKSVRHSLELRRLEVREKSEKEELRRGYIRLVTTLVNAFQGQDSYFYDHSRRVAALATDLGEELGLQGRALDRLELAALLHDIGLAYIDRELLLKAEALSEEEYQKLHNHPLLARKLLGDVPELASLTPILEGLREHYDGSGQPRGLHGENIPVESRIIAVAEAFDSFTHARPHRPAQSREKAIEFLKEQARARFDPVVVSLCADLAQEHRELTDLKTLMGRTKADQAQKERCRNLIQLGNLLRESNEFAQAARAYDEAEALVGGDEELTFSLTVQRAQAALAAGEAKAAARLAGTAGRQLEGLNSRPYRTVLELARLSIHLGRAAQAEDVLSSLPDSHPLQPEKQRLWLRLLLQNGRSQEFAQAFQPWLEAPASFQSLSPGQAREAAGVLVGGLRQNLAAELASDKCRQLVRNWPFLSGFLSEHLPAEVAREFQPAQPPELESSPEKPRGPVLEARCLGRLKVLINGTPLDSKVWTTRKAKELFALLLQWQRPVPAGRLTELLWPDGGDKVRKNLHTTVSRVRRALRSGAGKSISGILSDGDFYMLDPELSTWADIWELEKAEEAVARSRDPRLKDEVVAAAVRAVALYNGDFLEGLWEEWTFNPRRNFREKWIRVADRLAQHFVAGKQYDEAESCYRQILGIDGCREEAHLGLMKALLEAGRRDQALTCYDDYCKALERELDLGPSPAAKALYLEVTST